MKKLKTSLFGYNKQEVNNIMIQKEQLIETQKADIEYLRKEKNLLECKIKNITENKSN